MNEIIADAIGQASMCWEPRPSNQVFDSDRALKIARSIEHKMPKYFEVRDHMTLVPVLACPISTGSKIARYAGWLESCSVVMTHLQTGKTYLHPHEWSSPWMESVHAYITTNWKILFDNDLIDMRVVRGETSSPCGSEIK